VKIPNTEFHEIRDPALRNVNFIKPHDFDPGLGLFTLLYIDSLKGKKYTRNQFLTQTSDP